LTGALGGWVRRCSLQQGGSCGGVRAMASNVPDLNWDQLNEMVAKSPVPMPETKMAIARLREEVNKLKALCDESTLKPTPVVDGEAILKAYPNMPGIDATVRKEFLAGVAQINDPEWRRKRMDEYKKNSPWRKQMLAEAEKHRKRAVAAKKDREAWVAEGQKMAKEHRAKEAKIQSDLTNLRSLTIADVLKDNPEWEREIEEEIKESKWSY